MDVLEPISINGDVVALCVHLDQLEVGAVDVPIQEMVIELEHSLVCQLLNSNSDLERSIDCDLQLPAFQLKGLAELFQIVEARLSQRSVHHLLIFWVDHARLAFQSFNEFPVTAISQQFEDLSQQRFALVCISGAPDRCHLLHKPGEDLYRLIVDRAMDGCYDCYAFHIPTQ